MKSYPKIFVCVFLANAQIVCSDNARGGRNRVPRSLKKGVPRSLKKKLETYSPTSKTTQVPSLNPSSTLSLPTSIPVAPPALVSITAVPSPAPVPAKDPAPSAAPLQQQTSPESEYDPACEAASLGIEFLTNYAVHVTYFYELLTRTNFLLFDAADYVDEVVQDILVDELIDCTDSTRTKRSPIQGISTAEADAYAGVDCTGILFTDTPSEICYVIQGSVIVYLLSSDILTEVQVQDQIWVILQEKFDAAKQRRLEASSLLDKDKGIFGLHFLGVGNSQSWTQSASGAITNASSADERDGMRSAWAAGLVGISCFIVVILGFALAKERRAAGYKDVASYKLDYNRTMSSDSLSHATDPHSSEPEDRAAMTPSETSLEDEPGARSLSYFEDDDSVCVGTQAGFSTGTSQCYTYCGRNAHPEDDCDSFGYSVNGSTVTPMGTPHTNSMVQPGALKRQGSVMSDKPTTGRGVAPRGSSDTYDMAPLEESTRQFSVEYVQSISSPSEFADYWGRRAPNASNQIGGAPTRIYSQNDTVTL
jgi:hypothetical protein